MKWNIQIFLIRVIVLVLIKLQIIFVLVCSLGKQPRVRFGREQEFPVVLIETEMSLFLASHPIGLYCKNYYMQILVFGYGNDGGELLDDYPIEVWYLYGRYPKKIKIKFLWLKMENKLI